MFPQFFTFLKKKRPRYLFFICNIKYSYLCSNLFYIEMFYQFIYTSNDSLYYRKTHFGNRGMAFVVPCSVVIYGIEFYRENIGQCFFIHKSVWPTFPLGRVELKHIKIFLIISISNSWNKTFEFWVATCSPVGISWVLYQTLWLPGWPRFCFLVFV